MSILLPDLVARYLAWMDEHRSKSNRHARGIYLRTFLRSVGAQRAGEVRPEAIDQFLAQLADRYEPITVRHHYVAVRALYRWGRLRGLVDDGPLARVSRPHVDGRALGEDELPTREEVAALLGGSSGALHDFLVLLHETGARPGELMAATVSDFHQGLGQIVLRRHKRSHALADARIIQLGECGQGLVQGLVGEDVEGDAGRPLLLRECGRPWWYTPLYRRFRLLRRACGVRAKIVPYSFRHGWISEALMAGVDLLLVARMAGTSVSMIDRVYGHFRNTSYREAMGRIAAFRGGPQAHARDREWMDSIPASTAGPTSSQSTTGVPPCSDRSGQPKDASSM